MDNRKAQKESVLDIKNRMKNMMWTVSEDYDLDMEIHVETYKKSRYMAFYEAIRQGCFSKYFDTDVFDKYINKKIYAGADPLVLTCFSNVCIDSAVWKKAVKERPGVDNIRKRAFVDALKTDALRFTHTDWEYIEGCYIRYMLYGERADERVWRILEIIESVQDAEDVNEITACIDKVYSTAYPEGFAKNFKGIDRMIKSSGEDMKEYTEKDYLEEEDEDSEQENTISLFSEEILSEDDDARNHPSSVILLDEESSSKTDRYVEENYGKSYMTIQEQKHINSQLCRGIHEGCKLHFTEGMIKNASMENAKTEYVRKIKENNSSLYEQKLTITRQNIQTLANTLKRALLTRNEKEICRSEYGKICVNRLWNINRTEERRLFEREIIRDNTDFAVDILMDASGSQQGRQGFVSLQGYMISEALSIVGIPHRVCGFCTFGEYTILQRFRDYEDGREENQRIFEFYGSANNRDGLAVRAISEELSKRKEENKILILLSDGRPNDIIANSLRNREKEPYCMEYAVRDTALEVRKLRNKKTAVLGVFAGEEDDLAAEKKIFGKDFAYIRDISNFANVVGRYLQKQIEE